MNHKVNEIEQNLDNSLSTDVGIDEKDELNFHSKEKGIEEEGKKNNNISDNPQNKLNTNSEPFFPKFLRRPTMENNQNYNNNHCLHNHEKENNSFEEKNKKKFTARKGDWICSGCGNINFSFREKCNRCIMIKLYSESKNETNYNFAEELIKNVKIDVLSG